MRLIDADNALELFRAEYQNTKNLIKQGEKQLDSLAEGYTETAHIIKHISPTVDAVPVVHCKDCKHSALPSELTQRYGKPGTLTCHNMHAPSNRRNVGSNDFCSYGERRVDNAKAD